MPHPPRQIGVAPRFDRQPHRARHADRVLRFGDCGVHEDGVGTEFHRNGGVGCSADAGVDQQAAALFRLFEAPHYFRRAGKGRFRKAPEDIVKAALLGIERKKQVALQIEAWAGELASGQCPQPVRDQLYKILFKPDKNAPEYKAVVEAARRAQRSPLDLLQAAGAIVNRLDLPPVNADKALSRDPLAYLGTTPLTGNRAAIASMMTVGRMSVAPLAATQHASANTSLAARRALMVSWLNTPERRT